MDYMTAREASKKWDITQRRVQVLCNQGKVRGAVRFGNTWAIPKDAVKPKDGRYKTSKQERKV
ncbi:MAG TPA: DNA-binding protein [Pelotomaculum sp.]|nr:DNA-binding protein [Pelotomaculum sp.]